MKSLLKKIVVLVSTAIVASTVMAQQSDSESIQWCGTLCPNQQTVEEWNDFDPYGALTIAELDTLLELEAEAEEEALSWDDSDTTNIGTWSTTKVNPFNIKIKDLKDTTLNLAGYFHPHLNVITSEYGPRWGRFHAGTDLRLTIGDTIRAAYPGKVRIARSNPAFRKKGYGYYVMIRHANGLETLYGHLSKVLVDTAQIVKAGQPIGLGGNTGKSTGPHLHFEFRYLGNPINPTDLVNMTTGELKKDSLDIRGKETFPILWKYLNNPGTFYKVRQGDTLYRIAKKYHTTVNKICKLNRISPNTPLKIGRRLRVL